MEAFYKNKSIYLYS